MSDSPLYPEGPEDAPTGGPDAHEPDATEPAPADSGFEELSFDAPVFDDAEGGTFDAAAFDNATFEDASFDGTLDGAVPDSGSVDAPSFDAPAFEVPTFQAPPPSEPAPSGAVSGVFEPVFSDAPSPSGAAFEPAAFEPAAFEASTLEGAAIGAPAEGGFEDLVVADAPAFGSPFDAPDTEADTGEQYDVAFSETATVSAPSNDAPARDEPGGVAKGFAKRVRSKDDLVLGLHVTTTKVYGLLVRPSDDGYEPLRQFVRHRSENGGDLDSGFALTPDGVDGAEDVLFDGAEDGDVSVQFETSGDIDFSAEFAGLGFDDDGGGFDSSASLGDLRGAIQPIIFELRDILEECATSGFGRPALSFTIGVPDVDYLEVDVPPERKDKKAKKSKKKAKKEEPAPPDAVDDAPVKRERLLELLPELGPAIDRERVAFVPMTARDRTRRYLAVVPSATEPVAESLEMLREQSAHRKTTFRTIEAEVPLLLGLVRMTLNPEPGENTALVRVGTEDTVVLLLSGDQIRHYEKMQSVTAFDGPDTVCSRVLLQQDVQGVGVVHNVVVVSEEREKELVQGFAAFYPDARVETLREGLARFGLVGPYGPLAPSLVGAAGAAVAGHLRTSRRSPFEDASLLPETLRKKARRLEFSVGWHTIVVAAVLFMSVLYFSYLYVSQEGQITAAEQRLAEFPPEARLSAPELQARIDSLQLRKANLSASLQALDSLLIDTDRWTQTLLKTTRAASATGAVWIEEWEPNGTDVTLSGFATQRDRVVGLAQRLSATVEEVTFQDIRGFPVYSYRLRFSQPRELPQVARVLRERAEADVERATPEPLRGLDAPIPGTPAAPATETASPTPPPSSTAGI